jgi:hypothetical protein
VFWRHFGYLWERWKTGGSTTGIIVIMVAMSRLL